jgi:hypothetical protein
MLPTPANDGQLEFRVLGGHEPKGDVIARYGRAERRFGLTFTTGVGGVKSGGTRLPLEPGEVVDYHVVVSDGSARARWPEGSPERWVSVKRSLARVRPVGQTSASVTGIAAFGDEVWLANDGAGIAGYQGSDEAQLVGEARVGTGLPSNQARQILPDEPSHRLIVSTHRGLRYLYRPSQATVALYPLGPDDITATQGAAPVVLSPIDGSILFQLQPDDGEAGSPTRWRVFEDRLTRWEPPAGEDLAWEAGLFDVNQGCFLFAGVDGSAGLLAQRICGDVTETISVPAPVVTDGELQPVRIVALAPEPASDRIAVILNAHLSSPSGERQVNGLLGFNASRPPGADVQVTFFPLEAEIEPTAVAADDRRSRLLLATREHGILQRTNPDEDPAPFTRAPELGSVASLVVESGTGAILAGTTSQGFRLKEDGSVEQSFGGLDAPALPRDALPIQARNGSALLSSPAKGILELGLASDRAVQRWTAPDPGGVYGAATYVADGEVIYTHGPHLLRTTADRGSAILNGIVDTYPNSLFFSGTELWISFLNTGAEARRPPGVRLYRFDNGSVFEPSDFRDEYGTVADWIQPPEGSGVWAATKAGIVRLERDLSKQLSRFSVVSLDKNGGSVVAVGAAIEAWDGTRFRPVLFRVNHPRYPAGDYSPGQAFDVAIDAGGRFLVLYSTGVLVAVDRERGTSEVLDQEDGVPTSTRKILYLAEDDTFLCGSETEGMVRIELP